jgi:adenine-specific DNA-methyltransferase
MSIKQQSETRFIELMTELFQLDEAESLDFGLYRIIRQQNQEVREFLGEIVTEEEQKSLKGGLLSEVLKDAFTFADNEDSAASKTRISELEAQLSIKPGMTMQEREAQLSTLEKIPATAQMVVEYRDRIEQMTSGATVEMDRSEVLNLAYQFFFRHYQDGDFIVERRYSRDGSRYIRSTGDDTEFHWATEDMYYIKSGDIFTDYPVKLSRGQQIVFAVDSKTLKETRAVLKPNDKAHYALYKVTKAEHDWIRVSLKYLKGGQTDKQKEEIVTSVQKACGGESAEIKRWLNRFIARNKSDFFIHKHLKESLYEDLDIFIKTEVLDTDQLLAGGNLPKRVGKVANIVRKVGRKIIDFLAALEDFQKALWEKKKLVFNTHYVITLDRIDKLAGREWLDAHINDIIKWQRKEWQDLGLGDYKKAADCRVQKDSDLRTNGGVHYLPLPVDTANFGDDFKWLLLEIVTKNHVLDDEIEGVAIQSDNWQALHVMQEKYLDRVKCIYIDPPYNTGSDGFPYKDAYQHASWFAMIHDRLTKAVPLLMRNGAIFSSIDHIERNTLTKALELTFGASNRVEEIIWAQTIGSKNQSPTYSTNHEYVMVFARDFNTVKRDERMFREPKPGAAEVFALVETLNSQYPTIKEIEHALNELMQKHRFEFKAELEEQGIDYDKSLDPWRGLFNYKRAEYRDDNARYICERDAKRKGAKIWVWRTDPASMPQGKQADSVYDQNSLNYRFYEPIHPITKKPCKRPTMGWAFPQFTDKEDLSKPTFQTLDADHRISWGEDEKTMPEQKKFLNEIDTQVGKSVVIDNVSGEKELTNIMGTMRTFPNPKPTTLIAKFIEQTTTEKQWVMDFFAGSGTTYHAMLRAGRDDRQSRRTIIVENGQHFDLCMRRIKKVCAAFHWKDGHPLTISGAGLFMRVQSLEQYEDTLENLDIESVPQLQFVFEDPAFSLRYRSDRTSRQVFCAIEHYSSPFGYKLKCAAGTGEAMSRQVDLVESLIYLLGLDVSRMYRESQGVVITGHDRRGRSVAVFFRDCAAKDSAKWVKAKLADHPADRVITNDAASLTFEGCERFEAIESIFATQFGRA